MNIPERIEQIRRMQVAGNDATYDLVEEVVVRPLLQEMDAKFNKVHSTIQRAGGGANGSDTTSIEVQVLRDVKPGFWNKVARFFSPKRSVIVISLSGGWDCWSDKSYEEFRKRMRETFNTSGLAVLLE